jgi:hypothetical protein
MMTAHAIGRMRGLAAGEKFLKVLDYYIALLRYIVNRLKFDGIKSEVL